MLSQWRCAVESGMLSLRCLLQQRASIGEVTLPLDPSISTVMRKAILEGEYEHNEIEIVRHTLTRGDRILECGAGIGLLATYCALRLGSEHVKTFEANPFMLALIEKTFALNGVSPALVIGAIGPVHGQVDFHVRKNFWASSMHDGRAPGAQHTISVQMYALQDEILAMQPTYLLIDIEGAERNLAGSSELPGVEKVMLELHPELIGDDGVRAVLGWLWDLGFRKDSGISKNRELFFARNG
jgi:FkbM family methyltransferase